MLKPLPVASVDASVDSMVRSAAKNHRFVGVVTEPELYGDVLEELAANSGGLSDGFRRRLAQRAFARTAASRLEPAPSPSISLRPVSL